MSGLLQSEQRKRILEGLADGKSLRTICRAKGMPHIATVMRWCSDDQKWSEQYARARAQGDDAMAEDIQEIADREELDPQDRRVRIDARKWLLAKRQPKKYGDKIDVTSGGERIQQLDEDAKAARLAAIVSAVRNTEAS
jgi:hypothetical protein